MKVIVAILCLFINSLGYAQQTLKGAIKDKETGQPVAGASVFLNNTSVGTISNGAGEFSLVVPSGKFDLVVSSIGYQTFTTTLLSQGTPFLNVLLEPKAKELETVIIEPVEKNGWEKWGRFFTESFIGTSAWAQQCTIKNYEVIKFRHSKKESELTAFAAEPLLIENKALGFTVQYQLEEFKYSFKTKYLTYLGYPFFIPMQGGSARQKRWIANRQAAYEGSMMHFMRSFFRNTIIKDGFEVRHLKKQPNIEKERIKGIVKQNFGKWDSTDYYNKVLRQPDFFNLVAKPLLPGDSIGYAVDNATAGLEFNNYLLVLYKHKPTPPEYRKAYPDNSASMLSEITLINNQAIEVQANGSFYQPLDLLSFGYWAWAEKIAAMLPFDYQPVK